MGSLQELGLGESVILSLGILEMKMGTKVQTCDKYQLLEFETNFVRFCKVQEFSPNLAKKNYFFRRSDFP